MKSPELFSNHAVYYYQVVYEADTFEDRVSPCYRVGHCLEAVRPLPFEEILIVKKLALSK